MRAENDGDIRISEFEKGKGVTMSKRRHPPAVALGMGRVGRDSSMKHILNREG